MFFASVLHMIFLLCQLPFCFCAPRRGRKRLLCQLPLWLYAPKRMYATARLRTTCSIGISICIPSTSNLLNIGVKKRQWG